MRAGLSDLQALVLGRIAADRLASRPAPLQKDLAAWVGRPTPTIQHALCTLRGRGLVTWTRWRPGTLRLTRRGWALVARAVGHAGVPAAEEAA